MTTAGASPRRPYAVRAFDEVLVPYISSGSAHWVTDNFKPKEPMEMLGSLGEAITDDIQA